MKILILYRYSIGSSFNHWCNVDFYRELNSFSGVEAKVYGMNVEHLFSDMMITPYNTDITMKDLKNKYDYDVIIVAGRTRTFVDNTENQCWLPEDFHQCHCSKILIEPDFHKYRKLHWFRQFDFDIILHRHKSNVIRADEDFPDFKNIWFPFSTDSNIFKPNDSIKRTPKICFVGNSKSNSYYYRKKAINTLTQNNLMTFSGIQKEEKYIDTLQNYLIYLNGASMFSIDCAKAFEILSSGGILFTNDAQNGFAELFPDCYITYKNDLSDIVIKAKQILEDKAQCQELILKGRQLILDKHTHHHRCLDLIKIIKNEIDLKKEEKIFNKSTQSVDIVYNIGNLDKDALERFKYSYLSLKKNNNYNIKISEVGQKSNEQYLKTFISDFEYYYQQNSIFDASIAKNNAFTYLIKENLFSFMDIDILVPSNFIERIIIFYNKHKKAFTCPYIRLKDIKTKDYDIIKSQLTNSENKITASGILVCDKEIYKRLNGFDEEYKNWGGRDSDFYERAKLLQKFQIFYDCCLFHQHHERNFGDYKTPNKIRYKQRLNKCTEDKAYITHFKGLNDNRCLKNSIIESLVANNIKVCLLEKTCYECITKKELGLPLILAVNNPEKTKRIASKDIILKDFPSKTKNIIWNGNKIKVPFPLVPYLRNIYGSKILEEL